jgi:hypothetical protein
MPLTGTDLHGTIDQARRAIGFWMRIEAKEPIRVFVTYEALADFDPPRPRDLSAAFEIFEERRAAIEAKASEKFDTRRADDGEHEGQPIFTLRSADFE